MRAGAPEAGAPGPGRRDGARMLAVCAVPAGLFFMHGAPAGAAGGCHGEPMVAVTVHGGHHDSAPAMSGTAARAAGIAA